MTLSGRVVYGGIVTLLGLSACVVNKGREQPFGHDQEDHYRAVQQAGIWKDSEKNCEVRHTT